MVQSVIVVPPPGRGQPPSVQVVALPSQRAAQALVYVTADTRVHTHEHIIVRDLHTGAYQPSMHAKQVLSDAHMGSARGHGTSCSPGKRHVKDCRAGLTVVGAHWLAREGANAFLGNALFNHSLVEAGGGALVESGHGLV